MKLSNNEQKLIESIRQLDESPNNILLWYIKGLETYIKTADYTNQEILSKDKERIKLAKELLLNKF